MGLLERVRSALSSVQQRADGAEIEQATQCFEEGRFDDAAGICRRLLERDPAHPPALHLLGLDALRREEPDSALSLIGAATKAAPGVGLYHFNLANALRALGRADDAADSYARAVELEPGRFAAWFNLGQLQAECRRPGQAIAAFRQALRIEPGNAAARLGLAAALVDGAQDDAQGLAANAEALALLESEWQRSPDPSRARFVVAVALARCERWTEAAAHLKAVVQAHPTAKEARNQLANCYNRLGRAVDAIREYRETYRLAPQFEQALTGVLGTLNYVPDASPEEVLEAHREWAATVASRHYPTAPHFPNARTVDRRLRVGYVSPDLRRHPVGAMFAPVLECHDPSHVETFCYYNYPRGDRVTDRLRSAAHHWRQIADLDDGAIEEQIRDDRIDILVDLAGHTRDTRLPVFARKPAPVQVSWLGYFNTTGLATMDYFVTDPVSSPPGQERYFVETLVRLPATRFCYEAPEFMPPVNPLPALRNGYITFGCLNSIGKVHKGVLTLWARILDALPDARLLLQASALSDPVFRADFRQAAAAQGIPVDRLELRRFVPVDRAAWTYHDIDIALDPFPFCGGMTSLDALWMGVPVVTLPQTMIAGRQTASMLANLGLSELIAPDADGYVDTAVGLAGNVDRLSSLRAGLRERFLASPMADYRGFARALEAAYRDMWSAWLSR
jgi:protein O-GlcNAc transferase